MYELVMIESIVLDLHGVSVYCSKAWRAVRRALGGGGAACWAAKAEGAVGRVAKIWIAVSRAVEQRVGP
jgi:hypothetical protein